MPKETGGGGGGSSTGEGQLTRWVKIWERAAERVQELRDLIETALATPEESSQELKELRSRLAEEREDMLKWGEAVRDLVQDRPKLYDEALALGFDNFGDWKPPQKGDRDETEPGGGGAGAGSGQGGGGAAGSGTGAAPGAGGGGGGGAGAKGAGGGGGGASSPGANTYFLPGVKGKDFKVVRDADGNIAVVYSMNIKGKKQTFSLHVSEKDMKALGITESEARQITNKQWDKLNFFGSAHDIAVHGENRHPFAIWKKEIAMRYGGTGMLRDKEIVESLLEGYVMGLSEEAIVAQIQKSDWFQSRTEYQQRWGTVLTDAERESYKANVMHEMKQHLREQFGEGWMSAIGDDKLEQWANSIAKGTYRMGGSLDLSMQHWKDDMANRARNKEGTPAAISYNEERQADAGSLGNPEGGWANAFAMVRELAVEWLGYDAKPDQETLKRWAERIGQGSAGQQEYENWLRQKKAALHPELGPDETWRDAASSYKNKLEDLVGSAVGWEDPYLQSFGAQDDKGKNAGRLSIYDFEQKVRRSERFWGSRTAEDEGTNLVALLESTFGKSG